MGTVHNKGEAADVAKLLVHVLLLVVVSLLLLLLFLSFS